MLLGMYTIPLCSFHGESQLSGLIKHCNIENLCKETSVSKQLPRLREKEEEFLDKHSEVGTVAPQGLSHLSGELYPGGQMDTQGLRGRQKGLISLC